MQEGGQLKQVFVVSKGLVRTSGNIVNDLAKGLSKVIGGLTNGLELVAKGAGDTLNDMSKNLEITSVDVLSKVGNLGLLVSKELGDVVKIIPILGNPTAYVVKGTGRGVYYVVTTVGNVVGKSIRSVGRVGKEVSDLAVFTIMSTSSATEKTIEEAGDIVKNVAHSLSNKKHKKTEKRNKKSKRTTRKRL